MPHYHNFGWYYFAKYILGLAGMIFLYNGFLKEKSVVCVCPAEERELDRRKERNNESSSTGDPTDAPARTGLNARTCVAVGVENGNARAPIPTTPRNVETCVTTWQKNHRPKCPNNSELERRKLASASSSVGKVEISDCKRHNSHCRRGLRHRRDRNRYKRHQATSTLSSKSLVCLERERGRNQTRRILDAVATANFQVRNSFAEQENLELEAFVRSIVNNGKITTKYCRGKVSSSSSSEINVTTEIDDSNDEKPENSSSENDRFLIYHVTRRGIPKTTCKKHYPQSPVTSFTSVHSRSGTMYFTASSKGKKRPENKIHDRRCRKRARDDKSSSRRLRRSRVREESDETNSDTRHFPSSMDRRTIAERRMTRYRSTMILTL